MTRIGDCGPIRRHATADGGEPRGGAPRLHRARGPRRGPAGPGRPVGAGRRPRRAALDGAGAGRSAHPRPRRRGPALQRGRGHRRRHGRGARRLGRAPRHRCAPAPGGRTGVRLRGIAGTRRRRLRRRLAGRVVGQPSHRGCVHLPRGRRGHHRARRRPGADRRRARWLARRRCGARGRVRGRPVPGVRRGDGARGRHRLRGLAVAGRCRRPPGTTRRVRRLADGGGGDRPVRPAPRARTPSEGRSAMPSIPR